eukprot:s484_g4.t1
MKEEEGQAEAEMAAALQAQIRNLEQAELSQMRQGAQLQLRLEAAQRQLQELAKAAEAQRQAQVEYLQAEEAEAVRSLQGELQLQLEALLRREKEAEALQRKEAARNQRLDEEVRYWKNCGLILRRKQAGDLEVPRESEAGPQVAMEIEALRAQARELRMQIKEMERLAASGRAQEVDLIAKNQTMAHSISMAEAAAKASREKATSLRAELQEAKLSEDLPQVSGSLRPEEVEEGLGVEEVEYWRPFQTPAATGADQGEADVELLGWEECAENMSFRVDKAWRQRCSQRFRNVLDMVAKKADHSVLRLLQISQQHIESQLERVKHERELWKEVVERRQQQPLQLALSMKEQTAPAS